jgi:hypothetical protein
MTTKNKGGRPRNAAKQQLAEDFDVSPRRIQQLIAQYGLDKISDVGELRLLEKRTLIALRSIRAEREKRALEIEQRSLIPHSEALEHGMKLAESVNRLVGEALTNWPTELAGKDELQVRETLQRILGEFVTALREEAKQL